MKTLLLATAVLVLIAALPVCATAPVWRLLFAKSLASAAAAATAGHSRHDTLYHQGKIIPGEPEETLP